MPSGAVARLMRRAEQRSGVLTAQDAHGHRVSEEQLRGLVRKGVLVRVHRGVYRVAAVRSSLEQRALAACLACGLRAVASHLTAAAVWGFVPEPAGPVVVSLPDACRSSRPGIVVHRMRLESCHVTRRGAVPITRVDRTLLDLAGELEPLDLERAADEAFRGGLITPPTLCSSLERFPSNRPGIHTLRAVAADRAEHGIPGSDLEREAIHLIRA